MYKDPGKALVVEPEYIIQRNQKPEKTPEAEEPPAEEAEAPEAEEPAVEEEAEEKDA